jgi:hypothetical protein
VVIGHEKGNDTKSRIEHNFGMARPEGYRKAIRLMELAHRFGLPVLTLVDTPGAYPGKGAEERGQAEAIARCTQTCLELEVPLVSVIIGEGGSGGAVAFATANRVLMLEHAIYSVISPEGCASILWKDSEKMREAAEALRLTAQDLDRLGVIDRIIREPLGGAHRDKDATIQRWARPWARRSSDLVGSPGASCATPPQEVPRDGRQGPRGLRARSTGPSARTPPRPSAGPRRARSPPRAARGTRRGQARGDGGRNSTTARPGRSARPFARPEEPHIAGHRHAGLPESPHKRRRPRLVGRLDPGASRVPCG